MAEGLAGAGQEEIEELDAELRATIQAAGGVVCRPGPAGLTEVALVHRPAYGDWTFPKGKLDGDETSEEAAVREVAEETGFSCELVRPLGETSYVDRRGRDKTVSYWLMRPTGGRFVPGDEVDELRWLTVAEALEMLTYEHDRHLVSELA